MKKLFVLPILLCVFVLFSLSVSAEGTQNGENFLSDFKAALPDALDIQPEDTEKLMADVGVKRLLSDVLCAAVGDSGEILSFLSVLLGVCLLSALAESLSEKSWSSFAATAVSTVFSVRIFESLYDATQEAVDAVRDGAAFFGRVFPVMGAVAVAGGGEKAAAVGAVASAATLGIIETALSDVLLPLVSAMFAFALLSTVGGGTVHRIAERLRHIFMWVTGVCTACFSAAMAMQTTLGTAADSVAMRAAKYTVSGMVPIVGNTVSGALSTLASGLSFVQSTVGVGTVYVLLLLFLPPFVRLLLYRLCLDLAVTFLSFFGSQIAGGLSAFRSAVDTLLATVAFSAVLFILQVVLFMKCGIALLS